jgi:hypothetical protein
VIRHSPDHARLSDLNSGERVGECSAVGSATPIPQLHMDVGRDNVLRPSDRQRLLCRCFTATEASNRIRHLNGGGENWDGLI